MQREPGLTDPDMVSDQLTLERAQLYIGLIEEPNFSGAAQEFVPVFSGYLDGTQTEVVCTSAEDPQMTLIE